VVGGGAGSLSANDKDVFDVKGTEAGNDD